MRKVLTIHIILGGLALFASGALLTFILLIPSWQWPLGVKIFFGALGTVCTIGGAYILKGKKV